MAGGLKVSDPACDLAVVCAILSSNFDVSISPRVCFAAEVGLSGEIRPVSQIERRIAEAEKLGFEKIFISSFNKPTGKTRSKQPSRASANTSYNSGNSSNSTDNIDVVEIQDIPALIRKLFQ
ncbi:MAG: hypothetical protein A2X18_05750 [Bacteroidetes bacterium GWF2_40_14]|nr:MAG: hypothetical protein A2X18_05750 [Bacteroidetes bacterium GWF2_40_14]